MKFHKLCSGFFPKFVKQLANYLVGNGVSLEKPSKDKLGIKFDNALQRMVRQALVDGVNWGYWDIGETIEGQVTKPAKLNIFRVTEFCPLLDERTSDLMVGIRFFQIDPDKPMYVELFDRQGITYYKTDGDSGLEVEGGPVPYDKSVARDVLVNFLGERKPWGVTDTQNNPKIPVFPLYANDLQKSEFDNGLKSMIDAYDFINSDLADGITIAEGIYKVLEDYGGNDVASLSVEIDILKAIMNPAGEGNGTDIKSVEIPFQAKQVALELLRKQMYSDFMALDMDTITGGSLTNVAIEAAQADLDLKADGLCEQVEAFMIMLLEYIGVAEVPTFKRRTITNDSEVIENISTMLSDGYIDDEYAIKLNPIIPDEDAEELLARLDKDQIEEVDTTFPLSGNEPDEPEEGEEE